MSYSSYPSTWMFIGMIVGVALTVVMILNFVVPVFQSQQQCYRKVNTTKDLQDMQLCNAKNVQSIKILWVFPQ